MMELSAIFDAGYYSRLYPDLSASGLTTGEQLLGHFNQFGVSEGRSFSPYVDLNFYASANADLGAAGLTTDRQLLDHLLAFGIQEKRRFSQNVDLTYYGSTNPDLGSAGLTTGDQLFDHLIHFGVKEGRQIAPPVAPQLPPIPNFPGIPPLPELRPAVLTPQSRILPDSAVNAILAIGLETATAELNKFVSDPNFDSKIKGAFGEAVDLEAAKTLINSLGNGEALPGFQIMSSADIAGAQAAFDALTNTAYIAREFLSHNTGNPKAIASVLLEEIGHAVDSRLNASDAPGDEGAIFASLVQGKELSESELSDLRAENDITDITLGGKTVTVEMNQSLSLWIYNAKNFPGWNNPASSTVINSSRTDSISLDWGSDSADKFNSAYIGGLNDYFVAVAATRTNFEAGINYRFRGSADDYLCLFARSVDNPNNSSWITPNWEVFDHSQGRAADRNYTFTPTQSGQYEIYAFMYEKQGDAYVDVTWLTPETVTNQNVLVPFQKANLELYRVDGARADIANRPTWVVIHGMNGSPNGGPIEQLWKNIGDRKEDDQVLVLDWSQAADSGYNIPFTNGKAPDPYRGGTWITTVGEWAANKLLKWGISRENINVVGHSLGSYVAWEIAKNIPGGAHHLIALDPAATTDPLPDSTFRGNDPYDIGLVNFANNSDWAWAFYGSALGNDRAAQTAEESFQIGFPNTIFWNNHGGVTETFANMIKNPNGYVSGSFNLDYMGNEKGWTRKDGFEATIEVVNQAGKGWVTSWIAYNGTILPESPA